MTYLIATVYVDESEGERGDWVTPPAGDHETRQNSQGKDTKPININK